MKPTRHTLNLALVATATVAALLAAPPLAASPQIGTVQAPKAGEDDCPTSQPLACGATATGTLAGGDCTDDQNRWLDVYTFTGEVGETIEATLDPASFVPDLELYDPSFEDYAEIEGQFPGQAVQLTSTLDRTSNLWRLVVKTDNAGNGGAYTLALECSGGDDPPPPPPPAGGFFNDPQYPDFQFRVRITADGVERTGSHEGACQPDTVCVSGALAGRSEVFIRILGPRPNGYLWPTIVRFTPSRVVVDIRQISTGALQTYVLPAVPPGDENLSGRQDRMGFLP